LRLISCAASCTDSPGRTIATSRSDLERGPGSGRRGWGDPGSGATRRGPDRPPARLQVGCTRRFSYSPCCRGGACHKEGRCTTKRQQPWSLADKVTVSGLVVAATGVVMMMVSGVFRTTTPPGLFILLLPAGLVACGRWRWTPIVATLAGLFIFVGYFPSGAAVRLFDLSQLGVFVGLWLQFLASFIAAIAGIVAGI